jgi:hypothetical protein
VDDIAGAESRLGAAAEDPTLSMFREELEATTSAAFTQIRLIAATASLEAKLSMASAMAVATAHSLRVAFLVVAWFCLVSLAVWALTEVGISPAISLSVVVVLNVAFAVGLHLWQKWLIGNIGLPRTRKLIQQLPVTGGGMRQ